MLQLGEGWSDLQLVGLNIECLFHHQDFVFLGCTFLLQKLVVLCQCKNAIAFVVTAILFLTLGLDRLPRLRQSLTAQLAFYLVVKPPFRTSWSALPLGFALLSLA